MIDYSQRHVPAIALTGMICAASFSAFGDTTPIPDDPEQIAVSEEEAGTVVRDLFGLVVGEAVIDARGYGFAVDGFRDDRTCPLEQIRDTRCGGFEWRPSSVTVYRHSVVAPVSGHLARNRIVVVDMSSSTAGVSFGSMHGFLVFPDRDVSPEAGPAFAWYISRLGATVGISLRNADADGVMDIFYGYSQRLTGGVGIVTFDVWTVGKMNAEKLLSSGEKLSGVFMSAFDGIPLHDDGPTSLGRGAWHTVRIGRELPDMMVLERARIAGPATSWELHALADLGQGWSEYLTGAPASADPWAAEVIIDGEPGADCSPLEESVGLSVDARQRLLALESKCRDARDAFDGDQGSGMPVLDIALKLYTSVLLYSAGMSVTALALEESASVSLARAWPSAWPVSAALSLHAAWVAHREYSEAFDAHFADRDLSFIETLSRFPALRLVTRPVELSILASFLPSRQGKHRLTVPIN